MCVSVYFGYRTRKNQLQKVNKTASPTEHIQVVANLDLGALVKYSSLSGIFSAGLFDVRQLYNHRQF